MTTSPEAKPVMATRFSKSETPFTGHMKVAEIVKMGVQHVAANGANWKPCLILVLEDEVLHYDVSSLAGGENVLRYAASQIKKHEPECYVLEVPMYVARDAIVVTAGTKNGEHGGYVVMSVEPGQNGKPYVQGVPLDSVDEHPFFSLYGCVDCKDRGWRFSEIVDAKTGQPSAVRCESCDKGKQLLLFQPR